MGSVSENQIPVIDLSETWGSKDRGSKEWQHLCERVREACESYGMFEVVYNNITLHSRAQTFSLIRQLFELPLETKMKNSNPKPYYAYAHYNPYNPLYEGFGIVDASNYDSLVAFSQLMWPPHGHHQFLQSVGGLMKSLEDLNDTIHMLIRDSYGLGGGGDNCNDSNKDVIRSKTLLRTMKYKNPPPGEVAEPLCAHTDKMLSALIGEDQISGLEVQTKDGEWIKVFPSPKSFVFVVGEPLMAWSNGKLHAAKHRVVMGGGETEDRYSFATFQVPIDGTIIKPPTQLVINQLEDSDHPPPRSNFKEFDFLDFLDFAFSPEGMALESAVKVFAGKQSYPHTHPHIYVYVCVCVYILLKINKGYFCLLKLSEINLMLVKMLYNILKCL